MAKKDVEKALKRVHYLRILHRVNRISAIVRRVSAVVSILFLAVNVVSVVKMIPER